VRERRTESVTHCLMSSRHGCLVCVWQSGVPVMLSMLVVVLGNETSASSAGCVALPTSRLELYIAATRVSVLQRAVETKQELPTLIDLLATVAHPRLAQCPHSALHCTAALTVLCSLRRVHLCAVQVSIANHLAQRRAFPWLTLRPDADYSAQCPLTAWH
jgi:hypothetical protein